MAGKSIPLLLALCVVTPLATTSLRASDLDDATELFLTGQYVEAEAKAAEQVERGIWNERWPRLLIQVLTTQGKYDEALEVYESAIRRYPTSLTLRMQGLEIYRYSGREEQAEESKDQILRLLQSSPTRYASRDNLVAAGRYFAMRGEDGRRILKYFYDRVRDADPRHLEAYLATAELALEKGDYKVAAETLQQAMRFEQDHPQLHYLLAEAWKPSDSEKANAALATALQLNPNHIPSLLMQAEAAIDGEQYEAARAKIDQVLSIHPRHSNALALAAVLAHLRGDYEREKELRDEALSTWTTNPHVDYLIGLKLSQKYRFRESVEYQHQALEFDPFYAPANFQLAQDLLRLGNDELGWQLARDVAEQDPYNVVAHNLLTLHDHIKDFTILEAPGLQVRMDRHEAAVYGEQVLDLLDEARQQLCDKYEIKPFAPIVVEIFPRQQDFAIRTFGLPGGAGYLGVCFGRVITANSPASQGESPANWKSVLWHEFCHVVTLEKTKNRMPRWLSEGISVYEERQRNPAWGETMTPTYRQMLLSDSLTPVSQLSAAFLSPPSPIHLQFAYYESSLVVEFLIEKYGPDAVNRILVDLGDGLTIDDALTRSVGSLDKLDQQFQQYAQRRAKAFAPFAVWSREEIPQNATPAQLQWVLRQHPNHYWALRTLAEIYLAQQKYSEAQPLLEMIRTLGAVTGSPGGPLQQLAAVYRETGQSEEEKQVLQEIVALSGDALTALRRLVEIATEEQAWADVARYAQAINAINPLLPDGHQALAGAGESLQNPQQVVEGLQSLRRMEPVDPAGIDYRLAKALTELDQPERAKHHVLRALEEAPRYRDAHRLLLQLADEPRKPEKTEANPSDDGGAEIPSQEETTETP